MYEITAPLPAIEGVGDQILDELIELYEAQGQDCTCGIARGSIIGYVEDDMLAMVTALLLKHVTKVEVQTAPEDESELVTA